MNVFWFGVVPYFALGFDAHAPARAAFWNWLLYRARLEICGDWDEYKISKRAA
jgi:hypothetical protein